MSDTTRQILPVLVSIGLIITIAIVRSYSRTAAAITATMPVTIPLTLWIIYAAEKGNRQHIEEFAGSLFSGLIATVVFTLVVWLAARAGFGLVPMLLTGYLAWAITLAAGFLLRNLF